MLRQNNPFIWSLEGSGETFHSLRFESNQIMDENPNIKEDDAVILAGARLVVQMFDDFIDDVLQIHYAEGELYNVEGTIHEFVSRRNPIRYLMTDVGVIISQSYPNVASQFFADRVIWFANIIKSIELTGRIKDIYDLQADLHDLLRTIEGGILTNQLEEALRAFEGLTPDFKKLYMDGIKSLGAKAMTGRFVFDAMCNLGRGIPLRVIDIAQMTGKDRKTIKKGIDEILDNAGHLIRIDQRGKVETYYIPEEFRRLHTI